MIAVSMTAALTIAVSTIVAPMAAVISARKNGLTVGGWVQMGYYTGQNGMFNQFDNRFNFQQNWLYVEKVADGSDGVDFGGRFDIMYGSDAQFNCGVLAMPTLCGTSMLVTTSPTVTVSRCPRLTWK
ncbi:MAG: outer membrane beta-barrel protein [Planctomycetaceae bacterium]